MRDANRAPSDSRGALMVFPSLVQLRLRP